MAELVDATDSKSVDRKVMGVRFSLPALMPVRRTEKTRVIAIVGPTASGKSSLGIYLAQKLGGEVVSADSRQVYKGLDLGTGKVTKKEMQGVPHHLLSVMSPKKQFTVDHFVKQATLAINTTIYRSILPIVVGGTGLYADVLLGRMSYSPVPPNPALRAKLEKKPVKQLFAQLKKLDPERAVTIEPAHKRRLIRAIEIAKGQGGIASAGALRAARPSLTPATGNTTPLYNVLWLGLAPTPTKLQQNIRKRLQARLKAGMVAEAKRLHQAGISYKRMEELGLEYRYLARLLQGKLSKQEFVAQLEREINHYAKRQMRWFKRNKNIVWIKNKSEALRLAKKFVE